MMSENKELFKTKNIEGTPFMCVYSDEEYFLALGRYRLTETFGTEEEVLEAAKDTSWDMILKVMGVVAEDTYKLRFKISEAESEIEALKEGGDTNY